MAVGRPATTGTGRPEGCRCAKGLTATSAAALVVLGLVLSFVPGSGAQEAPHSAKTAKPKAALQDRADGSSDELTSASPDPQAKDATAAASPRGDAREALPPDTAVRTEAKVSPTARPSVTSEAVNEAVGEEAAPADIFVPRLEDISGYVRIADLDRRGYANVTEPGDVLEDRHMETREGGSATLRLPGETRVSFGPHSRLSWLYGEVVLYEGVFEIDAPTLFFVRIDTDAPDKQDWKARYRATEQKDLSDCHKFVQVTARSHFKVIVRAGLRPIVEVEDGTVRMGCRLLLRDLDETIADEGIPEELEPPYPLMPFPGHSFHLPLDEIAFVVDSPAGRAWTFEFATDPTFSEILCRVRAGRNAIRVPPFEAGQYYWRVARIGEDGTRSFFSEPVTFSINQ